jgi:hypothetical protein
LPGGLAGTAIDDSWQIPNKPAEISHYGTTHHHCSFGASAAVTVIQTSISSCARRITGMAFGRIVPTSAFGLIVRNAKMSFVVAPYPRS